MCLVFITLGFALEFQWTLGDKHQQEKLLGMLYYRLAYTLHTFSREPRNTATSKKKILYLKIVPRIVKMFVNIKHIMCVLLLLVCTSTPSSWISTRLLCPPKHCEEHISAMATHFYPLWQHIFVLLYYSTVLVVWTPSLFRISVFAPSLRGSQHRRSVRKRRKAVKPSSTSE